LTKRHDSNAVGLDKLTPPFIGGKFVPLTLLVMVENYQLREHSISRRG